MFKKIFLLTALGICSLPTLAAGPPTASIIQVHDMQMIKQQKFRMEELDYYNDVQQEKERYRKRTEQPKTVIQRVFDKKSKFTEQDGEIKIKYEDAE